ncbi:DNA (cytosine-5)-methyltransferase 1 [Nocardia amikacinitolerans]|uniref:DNA cytosine methyltransferase n=1 Tax=Nocardia amikacinitolerans TaxID=756689 RepID=UPI0020A3747A|nr:DNA cytosine methyltransferase [Nocardia amikacinitolerans]MCP2297262.1 DNA (cytosine-5)-methyltransferase 1 [Nocardia amikacinitolerans]
MSADAMDPMSADMVDLFAGPGGLDVAAKWLGLSAIGIELDDNACATRKEADLATVQGDVSALSVKDFPNATILTAGPPCQTFSVAGSGAGRRALDQVVAFAQRMNAGDPHVWRDLACLDDPRTRLVLEPLRWAIEAIELRGKPFETIVLEQVPTVRPVWREVGAALESRGYKVLIDILHAEEFGVPQTRRRAILIALRGRQPRRPTATHHRFRKGLRHSSDERRRLDCRTMRDALDRPYPFVVVSNYGTGGDPKARGRRSSEQPGFTVTGKVSRNRVENIDGVDIHRLTHSEMGRLQTFPHDYPWAGKDIAQQIGNAIPPRLAAHILCEAVFGSAPDTDALTAAVNDTWAYADAGRNRLLPEPVTSSTAVGSDVTDDSALFDMSAVVPV